MVLWVPLHQYLDGCSPTLTCYEGQDLPLADIAMPPSKAAVAPRD